VERGGQSGPNGPGSRLRWLLVERQGSVETTWVSGESAQHIQYDAYGGVLTSGGSTSGERPGATVSQGYTGHEHEDDVELINMGGRVYSPRLRRFLTADPLVMDPVGQGLNAYTYVRGNPTNATDPFGWQEYSAEDAALDAIPDEDLPTFYAKAVVPAGDSPTSERAGAGAAGQGSVTDPMATLTDWGNRYAGFTETLFNIIPNAVPENELSPARWVHAASEWMLSRNGSEVDLFNRRSREYGQGEVIALALLLYAPVVGPLYAEQNAAGHAAAMTGEVVFRPNAGMTAAERDSMRAATEAFEASREAGHLHPDGRQSTQGTLRDQADVEAARERRRAAQDGAPYQGAAGHIPDTTWTGVAAPPGGWMDLPHSVNSSMGAQSRRYPVGFRPTKFVYRDSTSVLLLGAFGEPVGYGMSL
jgi:RHS repeat-associated protein